MARVVFISPHLDDVVFSCGGLIQKRKAEGASVEVVTCFTESAADDAFIYEARRAEDRQALADLGIQGRNLGLLDAFYRPSWKRRERALFGSTNEDGETLALLKNALPESLQESDVDEIFAPLGVGWHLDHLLVHRACVELYSREKLKFYADRPYSLVKGQTALRLRPNDPELIAVCSRALLQAPYVQAFLGDWTHQTFLGHLRDQHKYDEFRYVEAFTYTLSQLELERAARSIAQYTSQIVGFFGSASVSVSTLAQFPERYFRLQDQRD